MGVYEERQLSEGCRKASVILLATVLGLRADIDELKRTPYRMPASGGLDRADPRAFGLALTHRRKAAVRQDPLLAGRGDIRRQL